MNKNEAVLIAGGYGVVGQQITQLIRQQHPDLPLLIAGRNLDQAERLAQDTGNALGVRLDMAQDSPLGDLRPRAVVAVVNDPDDHLLLQSVRAGIPYLDITRWTEKVRAATELLGRESLRAPVMLASAWMAGVAAVVTIALTRQLQSVSSIDVSVLYSLKDKAGPNSAEYMDRLATPFDVTSGGKLERVMPYTDPRRISFPGGVQAKAYRFDTPDQFTLPLTTGSASVAARIAFDDASATLMLVALTRSGIWKLFSGKRFTSLRRKLLFNPGKGASHQIVIDVAGIDNGSQPRRLSASIVDPLGQTHLTAVGALIQLERLLGLDGAAAPAPGIHYPDTAPQLDAALARLGEQGVAVQIN